MTRLTEAELNVELWRRRALPQDTTTEAVLQAEAPAPRWTPKPAIWIYRIPLARRAARALRNLFTGSTQ